MRRWLIVVLGGLCWLNHAHAVERGGINLPEGSVEPYLYEVLQESTLATLDDVLIYRTHLIWELALIATGGDASSQVIEVAITRIRIAVTGPSTDLQLDTTDPSPAGDLLEPYRAYQDAQLTLTVDRASGQVTAIEGLQPVIDAVQAANPGPPGGRSPVAAAASQALAPAALQNLWSSLLSVPGSQAAPAQVGPLAGHVTRTWTDTGYQLSLTPSDQPAEIVLQTRPTRVALTIESLTGSGSVEHRSGVPHLVSGELSMSLTGPVMTQPVTLGQQIRWQFARFALGMAPPTLDEQP